MTPQARRRKILARCIVALLGLTVPFAIVAAAEVAIRIFKPRLNPLRTFTKTGTDTMVVEGAAPGLVYDAELTYRLKPHVKNMAWAVSVFDTNAQGMRRSADVLPREKGAIRIACLGDSCTIGFGVPIAYTAKQLEDNQGRDRPYAELLEKSLSAAFPGRKVEVLNMGVPGYSTWQGRVLAERMSDDVDIVTAAFFTNDVVNRSLTFRQTAPSSTGQRFVRRLAGHSQLLLHFLQWRSRTSDAPKPPGIDCAATTIEDYVKNFDYMRRTFDKKGIAFVLIDPFFRDDEDGEHNFPGRRVRLYRAAIRDYARESHANFISIPEVTDEAWPENDPIFLERIHPNGRGHALIAERLHAALLPLIKERIRHNEAHGR